MDGVEVSVGVGGNFDGKLVELGGDYAQMPRREVDRVVSGAVAGLLELVLHAAAEVVPAEGRAPSTGGHVVRAVTGVV